MVSVVKYSTGPLYHLGAAVALLRPIENQAQRFSTHRWTSRLGLLRAKVLEELFLETEPEWRLYEDLQANGIKFQLEPGQVKLAEPNDPIGRAQFVLWNNWRIRYAGVAGFVCKFLNGSERQFTHSKQIIQRVLEVEIDVISDEGVPKATLEHKIKETIRQIGARLGDERVE